MSLFPFLFIYFVDFILFFYGSEMIGIGMAFQLLDKSVELVEPD